ncbi:HAMP domain-containing histidine kinase [Pseudoduganella lutea]|uniref:histidine kinase n=2 Tax=Pseudoduganella lutea TaxID=321985 RepID=A0A4P6L4A0_9BURK|nr:HAMP domain-containing histidine kinase [Pseudoduganella lutea]
MRAPLSVIAMGSHLIGLTYDIGAAQGFADKIKHQTERLDAMIGELLDALTAMREVPRLLPLSCFDMLDLALDVAGEFEGGRAIAVSGERVKVTAARPRCAEPWKT